MLALVIPVNIFVLGVIVLGSFLLGFLVRSKQLKKMNKKVLELENEMLRNHAEILDIQKEKSIIEQKLKEVHIPVISMNAAKDESASSKSTDTNLRKTGIAKHS